ncbi:hypothetical protein F4604DRAFT_1918622 [Suillus subluteus]|nr:hypothetical protein F4604DRAFT_1918622 [Suillus subluteus]
MSSDAHSTSTAPPPPQSLSRRTTHEVSPGQMNSDTMSPAADPEPLDRQFIANRRRTGTYRSFAGRRVSTGFLEAGLNAPSENASTGVTFFKRVCGYINDHWVWTLWGIVLSIVAHFLFPSLSTFIICFVAILPWAGALTKKTDNLMDLVNRVIAILIGVCLGNVVELIFSIIALKAGTHATTIQALWGSGISNVVIVLTTSSGLHAIVHRQKGKGLQGLLLLPATKKGELSTHTRIQLWLFPISLIPHLVLSMVWEFCGAMSNPSLRKGLHVVHVILHPIIFICYCLSIWFQIAEARRENEEVEDEQETTEGQQETDGEGQGRAEVGSKWRQWFAPLRRLWVWLTPIGQNVVLIAFIAGAIGFQSEFMVDALQEYYHNLIPLAVGLVVIPIVSNLAEHSICWVVAVLHPYDWEAIIVTAIGSPWQIVGFVLPIIMFVGWGMDVWLEAFFNWKQIGLLCGSSFLAALLYQDGTNALWKAIVMAMITIPALGVVGSGLGA